MATYTQGYSPSVTNTHAARTASSDAAFLLPHIPLSTNTNDPNAGPLPPLRILDIGCGPGSITTSLACYVASRGRSVHITGIDVSPDVLEQARQRHRYQSTTTTTTTAGPSMEVDFLEANVLIGLPFADETFDVVFSSQLFPHIPPPGGPLAVQVVREMRRVLKSSSSASASGETVRFDAGGLLATCEAICLHFYPTHLDLDNLIGRNMALGIASSASSSRDDQNDSRSSHIDRLKDKTAPVDMAGGTMARVFLEAGFSADRMRVGAGTTVWSSADERARWAAQLRGRLGDAETDTRKSWRKAGVEDEVVEKAKERLTVWEDTEGAWYVALQGEILGWK